MFNCIIMKKFMLTKDLSTEQIDKLWNFADFITDSNEKDVDPNKYREDTFKNKINKVNFGKNVEMGWYVVCILDQEFIDKYSTRCKDVFTKANIRILSYRDVVLEEDYLSDFRVYHPNKTTFQRSIISEEGINALKETYGLSDNILEDLFGKR